jgi:hypothetical protein
MHGDPNTLRFCERVPIFREVAKENLWMTVGQLYKHNEKFYVMAGTVQGCGRYLRDDWCRDCRSFMPTLTERPSRNGRKKKEDPEGKDAAAGEERELEL